MTESGSDFQRKLSTLGYSPEAISAVWPEWWDSSAESSKSATTELGMTIARRLGITPSSLFGDRTPRFAWQDEARYKNLGTTTIREREILTSFATSLARTLIRATPQQVPYAPGEEAAAIRRSFGVRGIAELLTVAWALGIPVVQTRVFPLQRKRMHAVSAALGDRHAIVLGIETQYPGKAAFTIAHELGHIFLGHLTGTSALADVDDPAATEEDDEEAAASRFAFELLTGAPSLEIAAAREDYNAASLAASAQALSEAEGIAADIIILAFAYQHQDWPRAIAALRLLAPPTEVGRHINRIARGQLDWNGLYVDEQVYLDRVLGGQS